MKKEKYVAKCFYNICEMFLQTFVSLGFNHDKFITSGIDQEDMLSRMFTYRFLFILYIS
jgi:hypothetical protein